MRSPGLLIPIFDRIHRSKQQSVSLQTSKDFGKFIGRYRSEVLSFSMDLAIKDNQLILSWVEYPNSDSELTPEGKDRFRMSGPHSPGEILSFVFDSMGNVVGFYEGGYYFQKTSQSR